MASKRITATAEPGRVSISVPTTGFTPDPDTAREIAADLIAAADRADELRFREVRNAVAVPAHPERWKHIYIVHRGRLDMMTNELHTREVTHVVGMDGGAPLDSSRRTTKGLLTIGDGADDFKLIYEQEN